MRSFFCLCDPPPQLVKAGIVEPEETVVARQRLGNHFPAATNTHATVEELMDVVFSMRSVSYQILNMQ
jgi:hypothetical protein